MGQIDDLLFEVERRSILFHKGTSMPDGTQLGYDGNPNLADKDNSAGEFLLYYSPAGTKFLQKDVTPFVEWEKVSDDPGGEWTSVVGILEDHSLKLPTRIALGGNRAIATSGEFAVYASSDNSNLVAVGLSKTAVEPNTEVLLQTTGKMLISGAGFTKGLPVFVGVNGTLTQTISNAAFAQRVGIAHSSEILLIDISQPIFIGE